MTFDFIRTVTDRVLCTAPTYLKSVVMTPSSSSKRADLTLYDGESKSDPQLIKLLGASGYSTQFNFDPPLKTERGLYIDVGGDVGDILIQFGWAEE